MDIGEDVVCVRLGVLIVDLGEGSALFIDENVDTQLVKCVNLVGGHRQQCPPGDVNLGRVFGDISKLMIERHGCDVTVPTQKS